MGTATQSGDSLAAILGDARKAEKLQRILKSDVPYTVQNGTLCYLGGDRLPKATAGAGLQARIQDALKPFGNLYKFLLRLASPVIPTPAFWRKQRELFATYGESDVVLAIGGGTHFPGGRRDVINLDIFAFNEVDLVADAGDIPIRDGTVDCIISIGVLEHIPDAERVVREMHRLLRDGGGVFCALPFLVPLHAAPDDYHRWTRAGLERLFADYRDVDVVISAGPTAAMLWPLAEWLALLLSFGNATLRDVWFLLFMVLTSPVKLLDLVLARLPQAERIASSFLVTARK